MFNKEATRWLGVWLDSQLKFTSDINERVRRARTAELQIRDLTRTNGLVPELVGRVQIAVVQSKALYGAEIWWENQKNHEQTIQQLLNCLFEYNTILLQYKQCIIFSSSHAMIASHQMLIAR